MFEPIHGSAPKYGGQNVANPIATIEAVRMLLEHVGESAGAKRIGDAVRTTLESGRIKSLSAGVVQDQRGGGHHPRGHREELTARARAPVRWRSRQSA